MPPPLEPQAVPEIAPGYLAPSIPHLASRPAMQTTITAQNDVDYTLDIDVPSADLEPRITTVLRQQRKHVSMKGFRPGKVPLSVVRKMYGDAVSVQVAEELIGEAFKTEVEENDGYDVMGSPRLTELDYEPGQDLRARVMFGVRPSFELDAFADAEATKFTHEVTDEEVDADIERRRDDKAEEVDAPDGTAIGEDHIAVIDFQLVDKATDTPIIGKKQEDARVPLFNPDLRPALKEALLGKAVGDVFTVDLDTQSADDRDDDATTDDATTDDAEAADVQTDRFQVTIKQVQAREVPEADEAFIEEATGGEATDLDGFKAFVRDELETRWARRSEEALEEALFRKTMERHAFEVPESVVETVLDQQVEDLEKRAGGELPPHFDIAGFREERRELARDQVRWMLVREKIMEADGIEVTEDDIDAEFMRIAQPSAPAEDDEEAEEREPIDVNLLRQFFASQPGAMDQMVTRLVNQRLFDALKRRFTITEKSRQDFDTEDE
ncbi:MAG: trigger factor [Bacteroidota bacterium]